jgi:hypothetical protein
MQSLNNTIAISYINNYWDVGFAKAIRFPMWIGHNYKEAGATSRTNRRNIGPISTQ